MEEKWNEMMNSEDMVLINKGDLFLLLHTTVDFFFENDATEEFVDRTLKTLFLRNRYSQEMADEFMRFYEQSNTEEAEEEIRSEAEMVARAHGFDSVDEFIDHMSGGHGDNSDQEKLS